MSSSEPFISLGDFQGCGGALLTLLLSLLDGDNLPSLQAADSRRLAPVRSRLVKRFSQLEFELHSFQSCGGFDIPSITFLENVTNWGGDCSGLPQQEVHLQLLQHLLILIS